jgi:hypothetical protein
MKTKNLFVIFLMILSFANCNKDDELTNETPLLVGVKSDNVTISNIICNVGDVSIDFDNDNNLDINFWTHGVPSPSGYSYSSGLTLLDSSFQISITFDSISPEIINYNDTISEISRWSDFSQNKSKTFILVNDSYLWNIQSFSNYSYWLNQIGFICIRNEYEKGRFKYGWIKIEVDSYTSYKIKEYAFMK